MNYHSGGYRDSDDVCNSHPQTSTINCISSSSLLLVLPLPFSLDFLALYFLQHKPTMKNIDVHTSVDNLFTNPNSRKTNIRPV